MLRILALHLQNLEHTRFQLWLIEHPSCIRYIPHIMARMSSCLQGYPARIGARRSCLSTPSLSARSFTLSKAFHMPPQSAPHIRWLRQSWKILPQRFLFWTLLAGAGVCFASCDAGVVQRILQRSGHGGWRGKSAKDQVLCTSGWCWNARINVSFISWSTVQHAGNHFGIVSTLWLWRKTLGVVKWELKV